VPDLPHEAFEQQQTVVIILVFKIYVGGCMSVSWQPNTYTITILILLKLAQAKALANEQQSV